MNPFFNAQEIAGRNNESVAVFAAYQRRSQLRSLTGKKITRGAKDLDALDWQAAEREVHPISAAGFFLARAWV